MSDDTIKAMAAELKRATDEVKNLGEDITKKYKDGAAVTEELKTKADQALTEMNAVKATIADLEQQLAKRGAASAPDLRSAGQRVAAHADLQNFCKSGGKGRVTVEVKDISSATTNADGSAGALVQAQRVQGIVAPPQRRMTVRGLLMPGNTASNLIEFEQETGFTNNAAPVAEGALKPESTMKFALKSAPTRTIAHWVRATRQILADAPQLASHIDGRLRYGLAYKEEAQLLYGDGTGENLHGIVPQATAYSAPITIASATSIDMLRLAMLQAALAEYSATGIVLNVMDWARIELTKDAQNRYLVGDPINGGLAGLWGLPVVATAAMQVDKFLVGAFDLGAQIFDRDDASVTISTEDRDNFVTNRVTLLAEERLALAVYRPESFVYGDFGLVT